MLELDQLTEVLASVSRDQILPLFAPDDQLNAIQVCKKLGLPISKVRRVRSVCPMREICSSACLHRSLGYASRRRHTWCCAYHRPPRPLISTKIQRKSPRLRRNVLLGLSLVRPLH